VYGLDGVAAAITSLAHSSCDPYSTSAKPNIQFIFNRIGPVDSQHVRALRALPWEDSGAGRRQDLQLRIWLEREP
jgi:hypothetical protein